MKWMHAILIAFFVSGASCAKDSMPTTQLVSVAEVPDLSSVILQVKNVASRRGLRTYEKPRSEMRVLNQGIDSIFLALYLGNEQVLVVTNVGYGHKLLLSVTPKPGLSPAQADELIHEVADQLGKSFGLAFRPI